MANTYNYLAEIERDGVTEDGGREEGFIEVRDCCVNLFYNCASDLDLLLLE